METVLKIPRFPAKWFLGEGWYYRASMGKWAGPYPTKDAAYFAYELSVLSNSLTTGKEMER